MKGIILFLIVLSLPILARGQDQSRSHSGAPDFSISLEKILSRSIDISLAEQNLDLVRAKNIPSRYTFFPTLSLTGAFPLSNNFITSSQSIAITSKWNLFRWGADYVGLLAAISSEEVQKFTVDSAVIVAEQSAILALITEIQKIKEVRIYSRVVKSQLELMEIALERYKKGLLPEQEVQKLKVDLANAKANLADSEMSEAQARAQVESLLGEAGIQEEWPWIEELKRGQGRVILEEEFQLSKTPDWNSAKKELEAQIDRLSQNWRLLFPSLDAQFSYGNYSGFFGSFTGWTGMLVVSVPLFDQFTNYSNAKAQSYLKASSETKVEKVQRDAKSRWQASRVNFQTAMETALAREETLALSQQLYQDNLRRFQAGRATANDLTIDRTRMNSAELFAVQGWAAVHIQFAGLCHSLGYRISRCLSISQ